VKSRVVFMVDFIACCSEQNVAVLCQLAQTFLTMSKQSPLDSFDTELFINETGQLLAVWDSKSSSYRIKKKCPRETLCRTFIEHIIGCLCAVGIHLAFVSSPKIPP
jgi:hypothetical protein